MLAVEASLSSSPTLESDKQYSLNTKCVFLTYKNGKKLHIVMVPTSSCERERGKHNRRYLHSGIAGLVDDYRFSSLIHIVIHSKVSCHSVYEHPLI